VGKAPGVTDGPELLRDPQTQRDPFPAYDRLRSQSPLRVGRSSWILLSYDHVRAALGDPARFSSDVRASDNPVFRNSPLVFDDPPRHTTLRRLVSRAFTPNRIATAEPWIRELANELLDDCDPAQLEFVQAVADPLPVQVIARMLGVPPERHREFKRWSNDRAYVTYHSRGARTPELEAAEDGCRAQEEYLLALAEARRAAPADDLVSALATAEVDGERLEIEDVAGTCSVLLSAGNLTTTRLLGNVVADLAADPTAWAEVRRDHTRIADVVEQSLRRDSPVQTPIRRTTEDVELGGTVIPAGQFVTIGIGAANRDPDRLDQPHLAFGHGIHYCLGAALARLEATVTIEVLAARAASLTLLEPPVREVGLAHRGHARLLLSLNP
jgi:cytochrome P450